MSAENKIVQIEETGEAEFLSMPFNEARKEALDKFTQDYFVALLFKTDFNIPSAAEFAGMSRNTLRRKLRDIGICVYEVDAESMVVNNDRRS